MPSAKIVIAKATDQIDNAVSSTSNTYATGGEEKSHLLISAKGSATITQVGDGDSSVTMRIYVDGGATPAQSETADKAVVYTVGFASSLEIKSFADGVTASNSSMHVAGWRFV